MNRNLEAVSDSGHLRALLTVSRELMQIDAAPQALALAGRAIAHLARVDTALLLLRGEVDESVVFDGAGRPRRSGRDHAWYPLARAHLDGAAAGASEPATRIMLVGVPARGAMAVLVAGWADDVAPPAWDGYRSLLETILELLAATLGRISTRSWLENLVSMQHQQMAGAAQAHADELTRRDEAADTMRVLALTDVLTGLNNRRGFLLQAEHLFRLARRKHAGCAVIYADIDGLKLVNDRLGHATGDQLIRDAADVLRESLRDTDVLARLGGDEFVAFALDDAHPRVILARLMENLGAFNLMQDRTYRLSISAGAVQCDADSDIALLDYVEQADRAMYLHKRRCLH